MMYPNANFLRFFPDSIPEEDKPPERSGCLRIGTFVVIRKILQEYKLDQTIDAMKGHLLRAIRLLRNMTSRT